MLLSTFAPLKRVIAFSAAWILASSVLGQNRPTPEQQTSSLNLFSVQLAGGLSMARLDKHDFLTGARLTRWLESPTARVGIGYKLPSHAFPLELQLGVSRFKTAAYAEAYNVLNFGSERLPIVATRVPVTALYLDGVARARLTDRWGLGFGVGLTWLRVSSSGLLDTIRGGYDLIDYKDDTPWTREMLYINVRSAERPSTFGLSSSLQLRYRSSDRVQLVLSTRLFMGMRRVLSYTNNNALLYDKGLPTQRAVFSTHTVSYSGNGMLMDLGIVYTYRKKVKSSRL